MAPRPSRIAVCIAAGASLVLPAFGEFPSWRELEEEAALLEDDECLVPRGPARGESSRGCALSALQVRTGKALQQKADGASDVHEVTPEQRAVIDAWWQAQETRKARLYPGRAAASSAEHRDIAKANPYKQRQGNGAWHGGGLVDGLNGEEQVSAMKARDADWHIGRIVYQVFVDRFTQPKHEDLEIKRKMHPPPQVMHNWTDRITAGHTDPTTGYYSTELEFWGGDLQGVRSKLEYVKEFADILYLQPIFKAFSAHKYDTTDYFEIDPTYGTQEDFELLAKDVHKKGMKLVLDGVFNHVGVKSNVFLYALKHPESPMRNWFFIGDKWAPRGYKTWQGGNTLAELRLEDPALQDYIWAKNNSVIGTWLQRGADGWRLDVGTEIGREYLYEITKAAHKHKYGSLVVGEVSAYPRWWTEALDGILSFWMGWVINGVVTGKMGGVFAGMQIQDLIQESSMEQVLRSWIVVSNHDLPRLADKYPDPIKRKFAMTLQFVLPGAVCIYYGEELGMVGGSGDGQPDPWNRAPMAWEKVTKDNDILNHTRTLVALRRRARALRIGDFHTLKSYSLLAFMRRTDKVDELVIILANPYDNPVEEQLVVPVEDILEYTLFRDALSGEEVRIRGGTCTMKIPPKTARVLEMVHEIGPNGDQYKRIYGHWDTFSDVDPMAYLGNSVGDIILDPHYRELGKSEEDFDDD